MERNDLIEESHDNCVIHVAPVSGIMNTEISNALLMSASSARHKYHAKLDEKAAAKASEAQQQN